MKTFESISQELLLLIEEWESKLLALPEEIFNNRRNSQNRTIKQIIGHMCDSATNNTHRVIHLQYQESPLTYPNYATFGNNDRWIAIQNYQEEDWNDLVMLWKYLNIHYAHIIKFIDETKLQNIWLGGEGYEITLEEMVIDFPRHFILHLKEIQDLIDLN
jgi:hypothetical protein